MGTMIQRHGLSEKDYRGERFADWKSELKGNNDLLSLTQPDIIRHIHVVYLDAGADIIETNTFNSNAASMSDYGMEELVYELNLEGAKLARTAADAATTKDKPRFVAGVLGPTSRTCSISPDVNDPGFRNISFDELVETYAKATKGLMDGGADIILIETVFDTLNAKAAVFAVKSYFEDAPSELSVTHQIAGGHCDSHTHFFRPSPTSLKMPSHSLLHKPARRNMGCPPSLHVSELREQHSLQEWLNVTEVGSSRICQEPPRVPACKYCVVFVGTCTYNPRNGSIPINV